MRKCGIAVAFLHYAVFCFSQNQNVDSLTLAAINLWDSDSLEKVLATKPNDTARANFLGQLCFHFAFNQADKAVNYGKQGIQLSRELGYKRGEAYNNQSLALGLWGAGNYSSALQAALTALHLYEELKDEQQIAFTYYVLANVYRDFGEYNRAMAEVRKGYSMYQAWQATDIIGNAIIGSIYDLQDRADSASVYVGKAFELDRKINTKRWPWLYYLQGNIHRKMKQYDSAMIYYRWALPLVENKDVIETYNGMALLYKETGKIDSSIFYASEVLQNWTAVSYRRGLLQSANILTEIYRTLNKPDSVIKYLDLSVSLTNRLYNQENERSIQTLAFNEQIRQDDLVRERQHYRNRLTIYGLVTAGLLFLVVAILLWRNNRHKQKAKEKIEKAYGELKSAQQQLIQSEKMASLGELTAGIAHEIQNPLNFVNNFSEVNKELLTEMKVEIDKGNLDEIKAIANDVMDNQEKINHHGKRADAIVKGMLQHSRSSSAIKEPTDINKLADEYSRLAYHGLRVKDKTFNVTLKTDFDESVVNISVIPQDIGRVIVNLLNNAFFSVDEKRKQAGIDYQPTVSVSTKKGKDIVEIRVRDNGTGIPQKILDKIFQPFFTTKPTGQGTGLGLSLSYDIVKAHGGELRVESQGGQGAEFIINLPV